ncbi:FlgO family outer membrane protein [Gallaecimonas kandeliae]|uniref:FlgO family outer membrane protein n=1 Tax=Gallaecimonas kandeliae TaxID=3029055 RepID=UPI00264888B0|nr:FlgO family outer membrane protein [Gallaecimonas kandeliae]WKE66700.1 FlgO family outer membrane protein [Gallaecimonas kandeliae]
MLRHWILALVLMVPMARADSWFEPAHSPLDEFVAGLSQQLMANARYIDYRTPLVVSSLVDAGSLQTSPLGLALAESFTSHLHQIGYTLVDLKSLGSVQVSPKGELFLSRDAQQKNRKLPVDFVLAGTLDSRPDGVDVNVRIIGIQSKIVVATAQGFLPRKALGKDEGQQRQVSLKDGYLEREAARP